MVHIQHCRYFIVYSFLIRQHCLPPGAGVILVNYTFCGLLYVQFMKGQCIVWGEKETRKYWIEIHFLTFIFKHYCHRAEKYGDTADECGEAFFLCGKSLLELAR